MSHRFKKKAPNTAVYRHFAVITVVCTGLLAMFAEGQSAEAVARTVAEKRHGTESQAKPVQATSASYVQQPGGAWGREQDSFDPASLVTRPSLGSFAPQMESAMFGRYQPEFVSRLSPGEREDLLKSMAANGAEDFELGDARAVSIENASRLRSGSTGIE